MSHVGRPTLSIAPSGERIHHREPAPQKAQKVYHWTARKYGEDASTQAFRNAGIKRKGPGYRGTISAEQHEQIKRDVRNDTGFTDSRVRRAAKPVNVHKRLTAKYGASATKAAFISAGIDVDGAHRHRLLSAEAKKSLDAAALRAKCTSLSQPLLEMHFAHFCWVEACKDYSAEEKNLIAATGVDVILSHGVHGDYDRWLADALDDTAYDRISTMKIILEDKNERLFTPSGLFVSVRSGAPVRTTTSDEIQERAKSLATLCDCHADIGKIVTDPRFGGFFKPRAENSARDISKIYWKERTLFDIFEHQCRAYQPGYRVDPGLLDKPDFFRLWYGLCETICPAPLAITPNIMLLAVTEALRTYVRPAQASEAQVLLQFVATQLGTKFQLPVELVRVMSSFLARLQRREDLGI